MDNAVTPSLILVTGPTASGKSALALDLAVKLGGEIVNADSVQFYRGFDIGSAKPTAEEQDRLPHHLFSIVSGNEAFDAGAFIERAGEVIADISSRGAVPVIAGGTGLYLTALLNGLLQTGSLDSTVQSSLLTVGDLERERSIADLQGEERVRALYGVLQEVDPQSAARIHPNDSQRIRRALEVTMGSGERLSALQERHRFGDRRYRALVFVVLPDREQLYRRIELRVDEMLANGFVEETRALMAQLAPSAKPLGALGYRQLCSYLRGEQSLEEAVEEIKRETRRFAKRQYTWWRHQPNRLGWTKIDEAKGRRSSLPDAFEGDAEEGVSQSSNFELALRYSRQFLSKNEPFSEAGVYYLHLDRFGFQ